MVMLADAIGIAYQPAELANEALPAATRNLGGEYLAFRLGDEDYAVDILLVQEIRSYEPPTRIADAPRYVRGVMNLRGVIVPIVDLRLRLGCERAGCDASTAVIVLSLHGRGVGMVVDAVSDVVNLASQNVKPAPPMGVSNDRDHILGIATSGAGDDSRMLILLDIPSVIGRDLLALARV